MQNYTKKDLTIDTFLYISSAKVEKLQCKGNLYSEETLLTS